MRQRDQRWLSRQGASQLRLGAIWLAVLVTAGATGASAWATCTQGGNSGSTNLGPLGSATAYADWNANNRHFTLKAAADNNLSNGICADAWFDWRTSNGHHYDARLARTCAPGTVRWANDTSNGFTEPSNGVPFDAMQKDAVCRSDGSDGQNDLLSCSSSSCAYQQDVENRVNPDMPNDCVRGWTRNHAGDKFYYSGGDPTDCSS